MFICRLAAAYADTASSSLFWTTVLVAFVSCFSASLQYHIVSLLHKASANPTQVRTKLSLCVCVHVCVHLALSQIPL